MIDVVVIGAGLTGLTAAFYLRRGGAQVMLLEEKDRVGGQIQSAEKGGFIYEKGPNTGVVSYPEVAELFTDLGAEELLEVANPEAKSRWIWKGERFYPLPSSLPKAVTTPLFTFGDKLRVLGEPFRRRGRKEHESLADMTRRRLGRSFLDYAVDPFVSGIYAGDPEKLITEYAMPKLYALEQRYGSFVCGAVAKAFKSKDEREKLVTKDVFSVKGGLSRLTKRLYCGVGEERVVLSAEGVAVHREGKQWRVSYSVDGECKEIFAENVISTVGAYRLEELLSPLKLKSISTITSLRYAPVVQVSVGVKGQDLDRFRAFGGLVPSKEGREILGVLFPSSCFEGRTQGGDLLLSVFIGGVKRPDICEKSDREIERIVVDELSAMVDINHSDIAMMEIFRYPKAIPQYGVSQGERLYAIEEIEYRYRGLFLAGAIKGGIGMADRIRQAAVTARWILGGH